MSNSFEERLLNDPHDHTRSFGEVSQASISPQSLRATLGGAPPVGPPRNEHRGRPAKAIWDLFERIRDSGTRRIIRAKCKYCGQLVSPRPAESMLIHAKRCGPTRSQCDKDMYEQLTSITRSPRHLVGHSSQSDSMQLTMGPGAQGMVDARDSLLNEPTVPQPYHSPLQQIATLPPPAPVVQGRLQKPARKRRASRVLRQTSGGEKDMAVARYLISSGTSFSITQDEAFKDMVAVLSNGTYEAPNAEQLRQFCLSQLNPSAISRAAVSVTSSNDTKPEPAEIAATAMVTKD